MGRVALNLRDHSVPATRAWWAVRVRAAPDLSEHLSGYNLTSQVRRQVSCCTGRPWTTAKQQLDEAASVSGSSKGCCKIGDGIPTYTWHLEDLSG